MLGFDMGTWQIKSLGHEPQSLQADWEHGSWIVLTSYNGTSGVCLHGNGPTCMQNKDFLRHDLVTLSEMWYNHCNTKGENGIGWKSRLFF